MAHGRGPRRQARGNRGGFTLVELLVVIAIIALLASILIPTMRTAVRLAGELHCAANTQSFAKAMTQYAAQNDSRFVSCMEWVRNTTVDGWDPNYVWRGANPYAATNDVLKNGKLWPFMGNAAAYVCPMFQRLDYPYKDLAGYGLQFTYSMNGHINHLWAQAPEQRNAWYQMATDMRHPSKVYLLGEEMPYPTEGHCAAGLNDGVLRGEGYVLGQNNGDALAYLHGNGTPEEGYCKVVFADGHVGNAHIWQTLEVTFDPP